MANTRVAVARGFSIAVVLIYLGIGGYVLFASSSFSQQGLLVYLITLSFSLAAARGVWTGDYRIAAVGAVGLSVMAVLQAAILVGLAAMVVLAVVLGYSGRTREQVG